MRRWLLLGAVASLLLLIVAPANAAEARLERVPVLIGFASQPGASDQALVRSAGGNIKHTYRLVPAIAASLPEGAIAGLLANPRVTRVEPDIEVHAIDAELDNTWGVKRIGAGTVHDAGNKGTGVKVAVIDSGIDYTHPDLDANFDPLLRGKDFVNNDNDPLDDNGHGTHVAGSIAAEDDGTGVVGVAPEARLYALKVLGASGSGSYSDVIAALQWAVDNGIQVTNNSYGSSGNPGSIVKAAFDSSYAVGVLHVAAAGNSGNCGGNGNNVIYPARWDSVIAVGATNASDGSPCFSSTGPDVELGAPGVDINSTLLGGGYGEKRGTSMASPHVAGTAALVFASGNLTDQDGDLDVDHVDVRLKLQSTAEDIGLPSSWAGYGLVDAEAASAAPSVPNSPPVADPGGPYSGTEDVALPFDGSVSTDPNSDPLTYSWDFGDGDTGTGVSPSHTYLAGGTYTVTLSVNDGTVDSTPVSTTATIAEVNDVPVAGPNGPYSGTVGVAITFDGTGSSDFDGDPLTYSWDFGDGNTGTGVSPSHTYSAASTYTVSLTVDDGKGGSDTATTTATIATPNSPPVADLGGPYSGTEDVVLSFDGSGSSDADSDPLTHSWDFGDGNTASGVTPSHTYLAGGTYTVTLVVNDGTVDSEPVSTTATIAEVNDVPVADPNGPYTGTVGVAITFDGSGSSDFDGDPLTYSWDFGDGNTGTGVSPSHTYSAASTYTVSLTVDDGKGGSDTATTTATVNPAVAVDVTITRFAARDVRKGQYAIRAQVMNENATAPVTITASVVILDSNGAVVDTLLDKTVTIDAGGKANIKWDDATTLPAGSYTAKVTIADEDLPEEATDAFEVK